MPGIVSDSWYFGRPLPVGVNAVEVQRGTRQAVQIDARARARLVPGQTTGTWQSQPVKCESGRVRVSWIAQWTTPTKFEKHAGNPIYGRKNSAAWDDWTNGVSIVPFDNDTRYRLYFCSRKAGIGFAEGLVSEPTVFKPHPDGPVLTPREDNWEGGTINQPRVVKVTETHWRMYYTGWGDRRAGSSWAFGLAESFDAGVTWKRVQDEPIMPRGEKPSFDDAGVFVPSFLRFGDTWLMYYTAIMLNDANRQLIHMGMAKSSDGLNWEKYPHNPILGDEFLDGAFRSVTSRVAVRYDSGVFKIWYSFGKPDYRICYAESLDGIHWERHEPSPVLETSPKPAWDDNIVEYPEVQFVNGQWRLWYCGNGYGTVGYATAKPTASVTMQYRTGATDKPDDSWSAWADVSDSQEVDCKGFAQLRATLTQTDPSQPSPTLTSALIEPVTQTGRQA
jgi:predicted GH43/DUF377 family glycosyl hydrolase